MDAMSFIKARFPRELQQELDQHRGSRTRVLSFGSGPEATLVAAAEFLAVRKLGEWESWGWEEILKGSWKGDKSAFSWTTTSGKTVEVAVDEIGRLPEIFHERVQASTVLTETHELPRGSVQIVGRRTLDGADTMTWYAAASAGASLNNPETAAFVVRRTDELKADWDSR